MARIDDGIVNLFVDEPACAPFADMHLSRTVTAFTPDRHAERKQRHLVTVEGVLHRLDGITVAEQTFRTHRPLEAIFDPLEAWRQVPTFLLDEPGDRGLEHVFATQNQVRTGMSTRAECVTDLRLGIGQSVVLGVVANFLVNDSAALTINLIANAKRLEWIPYCFVISLPGSGLGDRAYRTTHRVLVKGTILVTMTFGTGLISQVLHIRPDVAKRRGEAQSRVVHDVFAEVGFLAQVWARSTTRRGAGFP